MIVAVIFLGALCIFLVLALYYTANKLTVLEYGILTICHELSASQKFVIAEAWRRYIDGDSEMMGYKLPEYSE